MNDQAAIMIQIESLEGINNLDAILTEVPGIDGVWLGTLDARVSMGLPANAGQGGNEPEWLAAVEKFHSVIRKHDVSYCGFAFGTDSQVEQLGRDKSFIIVGADVMALSGMMTDYTKMKGVFGTPKKMFAEENKVGRKVRNGSVVVAEEGGVNAN